MEEHSSTNTLAIKFLCFVSFLFVFLNIFEIEKIYLTWVNSIAIYRDHNIAFLDRCVKYPLLSKTFFSLFSLFFSLSAAIFTLIVSINIQFFLEKCLLTYIYYNFYLFGPYLLFASLFALMNFDKVFHNCKSERNASDYLLKAIQATSLIQKQVGVYNYYSNDFTENINNNYIIRGDRIFSNNNYISASNIFNLVTTITFSFLLCLTMTFYETYNVYCCSILRKEGGSRIIGKLFWFLVSKNRKFRIYRRDEFVNNNNNNLPRISNNDLIDNALTIDNSRDLINNSGDNNEETSLLVRSE